MNGIIGKKIGMTSFFTEAGLNVACTVIDTTPNVVTQVKTDDSDGYSSVQLGYPGSIGAASYPAKVFKGMRMAGRTGGSQVKIKNLKVVKIFPEKNLLLLKGAIPGHKGSFVVIEK